MRYYGFKLGTNVEEIKENAKIELRHYGYDNVLESINSYMYQNMKNDRTFLVYREEDNLICAIFSYNEQKLSFRNAYEGILEMLQDIFGIKQVKVEPFEITMHQFMECFLECKRRRCFDYSNRIIESSNLWIYYYSCIMIQDHFLMILKSVLFLNRSVRSAVSTIGILWRNYGI